MTEITIQVRDREYVIASEEIENPPLEIVREYEERRGLSLTEILTLLNSDSRLSPGERWFIFKHLCGGNLLIPLCDPHIVNINVNEYSCVLTHSQHCNLMFRSYTNLDLAKLVDVLLETAGQYVSENEPFLEKSIEFDKYILRLSVTTRDASSITYQNTVSIRKHFRKYYTILDEIADGFIDTTSATLLAVNMHLHYSHSAVVFGLMGTRKTSLLVSLLPFAPICSRVGILQDSAEVDVRYLPEMFIEYFTSRPGRGNLREISLLDLQVAALRRAYDKLLIAEVRRPQEIFMYAYSTCIIHGVFTTIHATDISELVRRFAHASYGETHVQPEDFSKIRLVIHTAFRRLPDGRTRPRVVALYVLDIGPNFTYTAKPLVTSQGGVTTRTETYDEVLRELAEYNGLTQSELRTITCVFQDLLDTFARYVATIRSMETPYLPDMEMLRKLIVQLVDSGYDSERILREFFTRAVVR
ncbi:MAG: type II/IV secretion system ATPase subunit [Crenarchaeota archaeon]|nr:type II/IV secretion system ATPase subunit [Thermoproteota archaeon]